ILTDGGLPESAPFIEKNIRALGFKLADVKILLNSHAHFDHSGGLAQLKKDTGAKFYASAGDQPFLESGHITFGPAEKIDTTPIHVDHVVKDGESISLGGTTLTAHVTPGHTKGCTTWTTSVQDGGVTRSVMFFCSISVAGNPLTGVAAYPNIVSDYRASFARLEKMKTDIFLAPHGNQFGLDDKLPRLKPGAPNPFVDPGELPRFIAKAKADFEDALAKSKKP
ncbi:MAG: subclass metallo-beta-lactamase, partial [Alphaproteobacteria bacterium]|nr:subclass metallo-beta-lactamase [Alphaproteobacteria bacterium]